MKKTRVLIFTHSYPYSNEERFLVDELNVLASRDDIEAEIVPLKKMREDLSDKRFRVLEPILSTKNKSKLIIKLLFGLRGNSYFWTFDWFRTPLQTLKQIIIVKSVLNDSEILYAINSVDLLYFYWGVNLVSIAPFIKDKPMVSRFHGYDLYDEGPFMQRPIPFRRKTLSALNFLCPVSKIGESFLKSKSYLNKEVHLTRLGVFAPEMFEGNFEPSSRMVVSCSRVVSLKRVDLIARSLSKVKSDLTWFHFGDGPLANDLKIIVDSMPKNITVNLMGDVKRNDIIDFYCQKAPSLFLNVSTTEGVPVSAMEALSCGIPLLMTDVGGSSELVKDEHGVLVSSDISVVELALEVEVALDRFSNVKARYSAKKHWNDHFNADKNYSDFYNFLKEVASK